MTKWAPLPSMINAIPEEDFRCTNKARSLNGTVCRECDSEADPLTQLITQEAALPAIGDGTYIPLGRLSDPFEFDPTDTCPCIGHSSKFCPLNVYTDSGPFHSKKVATRGAILCCSGC